MQKRHQPSNIPYKIPKSGLSFSDYIQEMQALIRQARVDLTQANADIIVDANSPKEFIPPTGKAKTGVLFLHGLQDSPHIFKSVFDHFVQKNYLVRSVLLPGHGTRPGDLLNVTLEDWLAATRYAIETFSGEVENFYLAGFSTGAAIAIQQSLENISCKGLLLFAPAIKIVNPFAAISNIYRAISWAWPRAAWFFIAEDNDYAKYQSLCCNAGYQVYRLSKKIEEKNLSVPMYLVMSRDDEVVSAEKAIDYFKQHSHPESRCLLYSNNSEDMNDARIKTITSALPDQKILNFSHTCIAIAPDHPHYGKYGDYQDFVHYQYLVARRLHPPSGDLHYGAVNLYNLRHYFLQRLSYNPHFAEMMAGIDEFIERTGS